MGWIRGWEWIIVLVIVLLLFGVGRLGQLGAELGKGIRNFREALSGKSAKPEESEGEPKT
ncbi:MAG: twin-arginine translocase TatA/TatE family subunit [Anaerolineae bacterium]|nr:twin-arginine translocase TatA/TatE family subunit [Anaerolineae bacterium]MDW8067776.1 twin-arginine translocase TatA/TatE family subunit [Anaerolineae bacterium]